VTVISAVEFEIVQLYGKLNYVTDQQRLRDMTDVFNVSIDIWRHAEPGERSRAENQRIFQCDVQVVPNWLVECNIDNRAFVTTRRTALLAPQPNCTVGSSAKGDIWGRVPPANTWLLCNFQRQHCSIINCFSAKRL